MFILTTDNPKVWWPVKINMPTDGGKTTELNCDLLFELIAEDEFDNLKNDDLITGKAIIKDWKGISDADGNPLEISDSNIELFLKRAYVRRAVFNAYAKASIGAGEKNS